MRAPRLRGAARSGGLWALLLALCAWAYWPGLTGPALLDDNANLHPLEWLEEEPRFWADVVTGNYAGPLGRPLAMLSFSLEKLYLDAGRRGHKGVNLGIHLLVATLLFGFARTLFALLGSRQPALPALLAGALWLFSPLLLSSVLYSVQRMAQLSALLVLLAQWMYLLARTTGGVRARLAAAVCGAALVLAPLGKENGLLAIPLLALLEWQVLGFRGLHGPFGRGFSYWPGLVAGAGVAGLLALPLWQPDFVFAGYRARDFDWYQRLLTQSRILWHYGAQFFWAEPDRLGLYQDGYRVSRGLLAPPVTALAVAGWLLLAAGTVWAWRRRRAVGPVYGLVFYLLAHGLESTIFPLELYFEHRNYLPAMGLSIALAALLHGLWRRLPPLKPWLLALVSIGLLRGLLVSAAEAQTWSNDLLFHLTAINRFPDSPRANQEYARLLATIGEIDAALDYSARAYAPEGRGSLRYQLTDLTLRCMARDPVPAGAIGALGAEAADFRDGRTTENLYLLVQYLITDHCAETMAMEPLAQQLRALTLGADPALMDPKMHLVLAVYENHLGRYPQALAYTEALLARSPDHVQALVMKLYFTAQLGQQGQHRQALARLRALQARGLLTRQQRYNVSLFSAPVAAQGE